MCQQVLPSKTTWSARVRMSCAISFLTTSVTVCSAQDYGFCVDLCSCSERRDSSSYWSVYTFCPKGGRVVSRNARCIALETSALPFYLLVTATDSEHNRSHQPTQEYRTPRKTAEFSIRPTAQQRLCESELQASNQASASSTSSTLKRTQATFIKTSPAN